MQVHHVGVESGEVESVLEDAAERQLQREHLAERPVVGGGVESPRRPILQHRLRDHVALNVLEDVAERQVVGLRSALLDLRESLVVSADGPVVFDVQPRAVILQDVQQGDARRVVFNESHLR